MDPIINNKEPLLVPSAFETVAERKQTLVELLSEHIARKDRCREPELPNKLTSSKDGNVKKGHLILNFRVKESDLIDLFNKAGYPYHTTATNRYGLTIKHYIPNSKYHQKLLWRTIQHSSARFLSKMHDYKGQRLVGIAYFYDTPTPEIDAIYYQNNEDTTAPITLIPTPTYKHKVEDEDDSSPLSTSAYSQANQQRLIRIQQQAVNDNPDDDNPQEEPDEPIKPQPIIDDNSSLQQAVKQQTNAINAADDDDNENEKKRRDRRLQRQRRTKQQLTKQQDDSNHSNLSPEWKKAINKYLAREEAEQYALKHPTTTRRNGTNGNHGTGSRSNQPKPDNGPELLD